jgi:putative spermidine/putrescine transport system permease protein
MMGLPAYATGPERLGRFVVLAIVAAVLLFLVAPIFVVVPLSLSKEPFFTLPVKEYSVRWYVDFFGNPRWLDALWNSLAVATCATVLATVLGTSCALGLARPEFPGRRIAMAIVLSPMIVPIVIVAVGCYLFYGRLGLVNTRPGLILAHTALALPFVAITVGATLSTYDTNQTRAARSLGAPPLATFLRVTLPAIAPGVISGAIFAFAVSFDEVVVALFLTAAEQRTLPVQMFSGIRDQINPTIMAAATILLTASVLLFGVATLLGGRRNARA